MRNRIWRPQWGVSLLLEVLFGLGLFCAVLLIVFSLFPSTHRSIAHARKHTEALNLARQHLELERDLGVKPLPDPAYPTQLIFPITTTVDGQPTQTAYNITVDRSNLQAGTPDERQVILVTVRWDEGVAGVYQRQVQLETVMTDHG